MMASRTHTPVVLDRLLSHDVRVPDVHANDLSERVFVIVGLELSCNLLCPCGDQTSDSVLHCLEFLRDIIHVENLVR